MLVWELTKLGIVRRNDLEALIDRHLEAALAEDRDIVRRRTDHGGDHNETDHFFTHTGLLNGMLEKEFGVGFHSIIFKKVEAELQGSEKTRTGRPTSCSAARRSARRPTGAGR